MHARPVLAVLAAAALVLPVAVPAGALASAPTSGGRSDAGSAYLAGYDQSTTFKKASIKRVVVPELDCSAEAAGIEIGLGYEPVEGRREYAATVVVACVDGAPVYQTRALVAGVVESSSDVAAGDVIAAQLSLAGSTLTATLRNTTNPAGTVTVSESVRSADGVTYGAFPGFDGGARLPVPDFGTVKITKATVAAGSERVNRKGDPGIRATKAKAVTSSMPPDDLTFKIKYVVHCCL